MAHPPLQSPGFVPSAPRLLSHMSLAEFWVSVLMLLPGTWARACGDASVASADSAAGMAVELSCTSSHQATVSKT